MIGVMIPGKNITIIKRINSPYFSDKSKNLYFAAGGKKEKKIFEPSSGGIGSKLKTARLTFIKTTNINIFIRLVNMGEEANPKYPIPLIIKPKIVATRRFDTGPARDIRGSATFLF